MLLPVVNEIGLCLHAADFDGKSLGMWGNRPFSHNVQMLPEAEPMKEANPAQAKENSFFEKILALDDKVLKAPA